MRCLHELFRKIKNRRGGEEDEGLPQSPVQTTTAEVIENGLKKSRSDSQSSLGSMESLDEMDDDFFQSSWSAVAGTTKKIEKEEEDTESLDLNVVGSTSSLVTASLRHKLAVKPQGKRASSKHRAPQKVPSPVPEPLPEVTEEPMVPADIEHQEEPDAKRESNSIEVVANIEPHPSSPRQSTSEEEKPESKVDPTPEPKPSETSSEKVEQEAKADDAKAFGGVVLRRTGKLAQIQDGGTLRPARQDPSKRQTIAGDSHMFATDRKVQLKEPKAKDDLDKPKVIEESDEPNTEFTAMFNKLRKQTSQKRVELEKDDTKPTGSSILRKTDAKPAEQTAPLKLVKSAEKPTASVVEPAKTSSAEASPRGSTHTPADKKTVTIEKKVEKVVSVKEKKPEDKPTVVIEKKPLVTEKKTVILEKPALSKKPEAASGTKPALVEKKSVVVEKKPVTVEKSTANVKASEVPEKKTTSVEKRNSVEKKEEPGSPTKENNLSTTPTSNTIRSSVSRSEPQKVPAADTGSPGSEPGWIAMARRKTRNWDQKEKELEQKDRKDSSNMAVKRDMIIDGKEDDHITVEHKRHSRVLDLISNFQTSQVTLSN